MFTRKPRLQLEKFAINGAKRLLQHNLPQADIPWVSLCTAKSGSSRRLRDVHGESGLPPTQDEGRIPAISLGPFRKINYAVAAPAVSPRYAHIENGASELLVESDSDVIVFSNAEAQALTISCVGRMGRGTKQLAANASAANVCSDKKISDLHPALGAFGDIEAVPSHEADVSPFCSA